MHNHDTVPLREGIHLDSEMSHEILSGMEELLNPNYIPKSI